MKGKVIITCAVTGSIPTRQQHPGLPITPKEIADSALEAYRAGAAICHIHVRDPETGLPSMKFELYEEVFNRIRERSDMLINLTTGAGGRIFVSRDGKCDISRFFTPMERVAHVVKLKPDLCSLDVGSLNFGDFIFANPVSNVEVMAEEIQKAGVKPELEVFDMGHIGIAKHLIAKGLIDPPPLFQLCMGIPWGIQATVRNFVAMYENLPEGAIFAGFGIGAAEFPMITQCLLLGGHLRVGMEDNLYISKGVLTRGNGELVERAVEIARALGKEIASVNEAKEILGLRR
jgi:uncharacterized protein (DUF849 family)